MPGIFFLFSGLHALAGLAIGVGILLLLFWAFKHLSAADLKRWGWTLVIGGIVLCILVTLVGAGMGRPYGMKGGMVKRGMMGGITKMMGSDDDLTEYMTMHDMVESLEGKSGTDFDLAFIEAMIPHHEGAIDMAKLAQGSASHEEIKTMAAAIIRAQQAEIDRMKAWQAAWESDEEKN